jgi:uncharacterized BrkB/YihY/UPF0761 family membrane protein
LSTAENRHQSPPLESRLRLGLLAIWSLHASLCYALVAIHRHLDLLRRHGWGVQTVRILLYLVTVTALVGALMVLSVSYRGWRKRRDTKSDDQRAFTAGFTALASCLVVLYLLWAFVLIAVVQL